MGKLTNEEFDANIKIIRGFGQRLNLHGKLNTDVSLKSTELKNFGEGLINLAAYLTTARSLKNDVETWQKIAKRSQNRATAWMVGFWALFAFKIFCDLYFT